MQGERRVSLEFCRRTKGPLTEVNIVIRENGEAQRAWTIVGKWQLLWMAIRNLFGVTRDSSLMEPQAREGAN